MIEQNARREADQELRVLGQKDGASFQVIVLGSSGGPREDNVTGLLVRTPQTEWGKSSMIAVDAGSHLANIIRILERYMPVSSQDLPPKGYSHILEEGPFAGIRFPHISAKANGLHIFREILHAFLITHPHIDHLSGMAINTPALEYGREAKAIVALPTTIDAIKNHIFNDWLWPNLSDEGNGVGFVTYRRLIEGGNVRLGSGEARGYVNVCDGLATKCWGISHGRCHFRRRQSSSHQHNDSFGWGASDYNFPSRRMSRISDSEYLAALTQQQTQVPGGYPQGTPQMSMGGVPMTPGVSTLPPSMVDPNHMFEPVSSSAFFIRNDSTGNEILIFGDVEPDSVSMSPRNHTVWDDAAGKIVSGVLKAIFIECSYDDSVRNEDLYGHLCPRHLIAELSFLAKCVINKSKQQNDQDFNSVGARLGESEFAVPEISMKQPPTPNDMKKKRKRALNGDLATTPELAPTNFDSVPSPQPPLPGSYVGTRGGSTRRRVSRDANSLAQPSPTFGRGRSVQFQPGSGSPSLLASTGPGATHAGATANHSHSQSMSSQRERFSDPLKGVAVHIIHVKDTLMDGPSPGDVILGQLRAQGEEAGLGVSFNVTHYGDSIWL
ncbi:3',5'-cyclic-nucleotide phosphodiesterase pde1 [Elasticomyces elasticus]|uniref:3',5'-cyclic-nucleotide phosphodiesterase pde1 n=1 Tax=Exophiala sideris TaxID=1016849 RepID=A0ABR0JFT1_9EURO|nr:3',5'-cyclic-nucleotide phosphodiesterase pde1 [Elasticomyces elasticus]KAK5025215.1 3',5'-cyclic-nucleotide phosphodiesterase pde1 [Exophiala sideris]KAK5029237.1 3',5'-cyclic-nucleotide phosphodiesterase pde1 [Exophiala sideris]KAK5063274.1 3',5'-cyclic-nucleotide phosphodiesterase pde1 [Exophiala sideris]KAK5178990.1 3',5'-cyclic-nucleotide phosphodiesterase pde1 [Eurotiomycetes sp. CCFEE 6388]